MSGIVFGKLPAHGDFVARGLGADEREALDRWLSASLLAAREAWGADFAARYDRALPWRCEGAAAGGALAASQDAAGRRFPVLVIGAAGQAERAEALLYAAIGEGWTADRLADEAGTPLGAPHRWYGPDGALEGQAPSDLVAAMLR